MHEPLDGFYQGTRFDRSGVFGSVSFGGVEFCAPWYERYDPLMHDAVLGPAEEFSPIFLPAPSSPRAVLKIGVGLLRFRMTAPTTVSACTKSQTLASGAWSILRIQ